MRLAVFPIYIVKQYERGIQEFFGQYQHFMTPGIHFQIPFVQITRIRDIREHTMDIEPQPVITKDNVEIKVDCLIWVRPGLESDDIKRTFYNIDDWKLGTRELAKTNLRQAFGELTLDESLIAREKISASLQNNLDELTNEWGLKVRKVEIRLIDPPDDIKRAMHKQKTAEQERRAMRLLATGKFEASQQEKLAEIELAEGRKQAEIKVAEGRAKAIELVNKAADNYFRGNAKELKTLEMTENSLRENSTIILTEKGISPTLLIGDLPFPNSNGQLHTESPVSLSSKS